MKLSINYGLHRWWISDNQFYLLLFIFSYIVCLKQKQKRNKKKISEEEKNIKIRRMLNIWTNKLIFIFVSVYLLAILKTKSAPLILQSGVTQLIVSNFRNFLSKGIGTILFAKLLAVGSGPIIIGSLPLILIVLIYSYSSIDCNLPKIERSFHSLQYIEIKINDDAPIIMAPHTDKLLSDNLLYYEFKEIKISSFRIFRLYVQNKCLGPEPIQRNSHIKPKKWILLNERTKTLSEEYCADIVDSSFIVEVKDKTFLDLESKIYEIPIADQYKLYSKHIVSGAHLTETKFSDVKVIFIYITKNLPGTKTKLRF